MTFMDDALWWLRDVQKSYGSIWVGASRDCHPEMTNLQCLQLNPCNLTPSVICVGLLPVLIMLYVTRPPSFEIARKRWALWVLMLCVGALMEAAHT